MKYYVIEPSYKKSVIEYTLFKRQVEGDMQFLRKELGWRWGSFGISVPETEEEAMAHIKDQGYEEDVLHWASDFGYADIVDEKEVLPDDFNLIEAIYQEVMPSEDDDFVDLTEDYDAEMLDCFDGCWEFWFVDGGLNELPEDVQEAITEEVEEAYSENYEEGVEDLGWDFVASYFEMHCSPVIKEADSSFKVLDDADN